MEYKREKTGAGSDGIFMGIPGLERAIRIRCTGNAICIVVLWLGICNFFLYLVTVGS